MEIARLVLEFLKTILSPQVVAGCICLVFFKTFKADIVSLMGRIAKIRLPGGAEVSTSQVERVNEEKVARDAQPQIQGEEEIPFLNNVSVSPEDVKVIQQAFMAERTNAYLWEYRYLNYFLVDATQRVLDWLTLPHVNATLALFDSVWMPLIPSAEERRVTIQVLEMHHLVQIRGKLIEVTPKGLEYVQWRGPLPLLPGK